LLLQFLLSEALFLEQFLLFFKLSKPSIVPLMELAILAMIDRDQKSRSGSLLVLGGRCCENVLQLTLSFWLYRALFSDGRRWLGFGLQIDICYC